jgi:hypothetical protein
MRAGEALPTRTASWMNVITDRDGARGDRASECPPADPLSGGVGKSYPIDSPTGENLICGFSAVWMIVHGRADPSRRFVRNLSR